MLRLMKNKPGSSKVVIVVAGMYNDIKIMWPNHVTQGTGHIKLSTIEITHSTSYAWLSVKGQGAWPMHISKSYELPVRMTFHKIT